MISVVPAAFPLARWLAGLLGLVVLLGFVGLRGYQTGVTEGKRDAESRLQAALLEASRQREAQTAKVAQANARALAAEHRAAQRIAEINRKTPERVEQAKEAIHEAPAFAVTVRPDALDRLRLDDLAGLADAARRSAELSDSILPALPAASGERRQTPGFH